MPGPVNQLLPSGYIGPSGTSPDDPSYSFGSVYQLPRFNPPATYTGAIPTPPANYGSTSAELPHDYYNALNYLRQSGQSTPQLEQWLQAIYLRRQSQT